MITAGVTALLATFSLDTREVKRSCCDFVENLRITVETRNYLDIRRREWLDGAPVTRASGLCHRDQHGAFIADDRPEDSVSMDSVARPVTSASASIR